MNNGFESFGYTNPSEDSGNFERSSEDKLKMQKIGQVAEKQSRMELIKETLARFKETASDVSRETKVFAHKAAKAFKEHIREVCATISLAAVLAGCGVVGDQANSPQKTPEPKVEVTSLAGEQANGLQYDYSGYNSPEKLNRNNFGEDLRKYHGDRDAMVEAMMDEASKNPEMLVSEAYYILTPSQKERAGIANKSISEIDNALNEEGGGELQQSIFKELNTTMHDKEHTDVHFFTANGRVWSAFEYNVDTNGDGKQTPDETYVGTSAVYRNNTKQFRVVNAPNDQEKTETNINEYCGAQPDATEKPEDVREITPDEVVNTPPELDNTEPEPDGNKPKSYENLENIDNQIKKDIAKDIDSNEIRIKPNPQVSEDETTYKASSEVYEYTGPNIVQNDTSDNTETYYFESPENNYGEDRGGAHKDEYAPVQENQSGQEEADANAIPNDELPYSSSPESYDVLADLGIN